MLYPNAILISLCLNNQFLSIQTTDHLHGKSVRFLAHRFDLLKLLDGKVSQVCDTDLRNMMRCYIFNKKNVFFDMTFLRETDYARGTLAGYHQTFVIPCDSLRHALEGESMKIMLLNREGETRCPITFAESGHAVIARLNKRERRALSKALALSFRWRDDEVYMSRDWYDRDFFFRSAHSISGGFLLSSRMIVGKDGREHEELRYSVHT